MKPKECLDAFQTVSKDFMRHQGVSAAFQEAPRISTSFRCFQGLLRNDSKGFMGFSESFRVVSGVSGAFQKVPWISRSSQKCSWRFQGRISWRFQGCFRYSKKISECFRTVSRGIFAS